MKREREKTKPVHTHIHTHREPEILQKCSLVPRNEICVTLTLIIMSNNKDISRSITCLSIQWYWNLRNASSLWKKKRNLWCAYSCHISKKRRHKQDPFYVFGSSKKYLKLDLMFCPVFLYTGHFLARKTSTFLSLEWGLTTNYRPLWLLQAWHFTAENILRARRSNSDGS